MYAIFNEVVSLSLLKVKKFNDKYPKRSRTLRQAEKIGQAEKRGIRVTVR